MNDTQAIEIVLAFLVSAGFYAAFSLISKLAKLHEETHNRLVQHLRDHGEEF